jgi:hypothetical protein
MNGTRFDRWFRTICSLLVLCGLCAPVARADCPLYRLPTNRFGVDVSSGYGNMTSYDVAALHLSWYSDWSSDLAPLRPGGVEYAQTIWMDTYSAEPGVLHWSIGKGSTVATDSWDALAQFVAANPGALWLVGSEPECPNSPGGGSMTPQQYGDIYYQMYHHIKQYDSTARIAIGGVVQPTALRLKWLNQLWTYYQTTYGEVMPVDVWNIHVLILREEAGSWGAGIPVGLTDTQGLLIDPPGDFDIELFKQLVLDFRTWMNNLVPSQRNKPLIITEYGVLMPEAWGATPAVVNAYMNASFDYLLTKTDATVGYAADSNHLVQRWLWCSLNDSPANFNGGLFDYQVSTFPGSLTAHGTNFISYTNALLTGLTGTACITGTVSMEARPTAPNASYVTTATLTLLPTNCPQPDIRSVTTDSYGRFTVCKVMTGTYDIIAKGFNTLATRVEDKVLPSSGLSVTLGSLLSGDANNDNKVTIADFTILRAAYRTVKGDAAYDIRADFNNDGKVNIQDFSLLATHFSQAGAQAW